MGDTVSDQQHPERSSRGMTAEERRLVDRSRQGDRDAFDDLVRLYERRVYNFAFRLCGNHHDACDIASDAFVRLYQAIRGFRGDSSFVTWLFRIVTNIYLDMRKRDRSHRQQSLQEMVELEESSVARQIEDPHPTPHAAAQASERTALLNSAIDSLPEHQRIMVVMYHHESQSYEEIAAALELPVGTVKSRLNRARLALRDRLRAHPEHFPSD
ncbi:MAG TPA: sigma-70 family RNA polymerase sigma factor [Chthonomonadales bacterium]|nr:sigma-70 family RNA polymerase sigma factor [Chthonomonadales bacterium]